MRWLWILSVNTSLIFNITSLVLTKKACTSIFLLPVVTSSTHRLAFIENVSTCAFHTVHANNKLPSQIKHIGNTTILHPKELHARLRKSRPPFGSSRLLIISRPGTEGRKPNKIHVRGPRINVPWRRYRAKEMLPRNTKARFEKTRWRVGDISTEWINIIAPTAAMTLSFAPNNN